MLVFTRVLLEGGFIVHVLESSAVDRRAVAVDAAGSRWYRLSQGGVMLLPSSYPLKTCEL